MSADTAPAALTFDDVHAGYGAKQVLAGLRLTIGAGEVYALFGPNGAGKSTAARVACGLLAPTRGQVRRPMPGTGGISISPQQDALFSHLSIEENLYVIARASGGRGKQVPNDVARALRLAACEERAKERIAVLSGGWRRRANLAAALVGQPHLIVADEPTQGVDVQTRSVLADALRAAAADGAGCLLISHDARFVETAADRVGFLRSGRLIKEGNPAALLKEAFGAHRTLAARFAQAPAGAVREDLVEAGFVPSGDSLVWRRIGEEPFEIARRLANVVNLAGGDIVVSRPDLDDLSAALHEDRHDRHH